LKLRLSGGLVQSSPWGARMKQPSNWRNPRSCRARCPSARLRQGRWSLAYVRVCGLPRPSAVSRILGLNEANVNIFGETLLNGQGRFHTIRGSTSKPPLVQDEPRGGRPMKFDSTVEAQVTMMACSAPPQGAALSFDT